MLQTDDAYLLRQLWSLFGSSISGVHFYRHLITGPIVPCWLGCDGDGS